MIGFLLFVSLSLSLHLFSLQGRFSGERQGSVFIHSILCSVQNNSGTVLCFYPKICPLLNCTVYRMQVQSVLCFHHAKRKDGKCWLFSLTEGLVFDLGRLREMFLKFICYSVDILLRLMEDLCKVSLRLSIKSVDGIFLAVGSGFCINQQ